MATQSRVVADLSKLEEFLTNISGKYVARVGILGADAEEQHEQSDMTNAEIGLIQEFGSQSRNIPPRSFLRMPIEMRQETIIQQLSRRRTQEKLEAGDIKGVYTDLGIAAEAVVQGAFVTQGFGQWEDNAESTIERKGSDRPLIDQGQLRRAISSDVVGKGEV